MNWKTEAAEKLQKYDAMRRAVTGLPQQIAQLEAEYTAVSSTMGAGVTTGKNVRQREERMLNNIVCRQELQRSLDQARQWLETVNLALGVLTPVEKRILHHFYIAPTVGSMDRLCNDLGLEKSSIYRHREKALQRFTLALYGAAESI